LNNKPIVALESTIISHGMPYPDNIDTALELESIIRSNDCIPATIGIINGDIIVGLNKEQINILATNKEVVKVSRRDLAYCVTKKLCGSTTVAATMMICSLVGIKFFATGGIGGVHKNAETTFDVSADLDEFVTSNICVICAGAKAILDLEKTMEYLETKGIAVIGYKSDYLAAFYSTSSCIKLNMRFDTPNEIAKYLINKDNLKINNGVIISNPIDIQYEIPYEKMKTEISKAIHQAELLNIKGSALTPFLLEYISKLTNNASLMANKSLIYSNARLASEIAKAYYSLK